jgi:hypothetical protein
VDCCFVSIENRGWCMTMCTLFILFIIKAISVCFTKLLKEQGAAFKIVSFDLVGAGHDDLFSFAKLVCPIFEEIHVSYDE